LSRLSAEALEATQAPREGTVMGIVRSRAGARLLRASAAGA
jgi:hypothetical protein